MDSSFCKKIIIGVFFLGAEISAMDLDKTMQPPKQFKLLDKDSQKRIFQVKSLNQLDRREFALTSTACGYYSVHNCFEIMKALKLGVSSSKSEVDDVEAINKKFVKIDSQQRVFILRERLLLQVKGYVSDQLRIKLKEEVSLLDHPEWHKDVENLSEIARISLQSVNPKSTHAINNSFISWTIDAEVFFEAFQRASKKQGNLHDSYLRIFEKYEESAQAFNSNFSLLRENQGKNQASIRDFKGFFQNLFGDSDFIVFTFDAESEVYKKIDWGNWLDGNEIVDLIKFINDKDQSSFSIGILDMKGSFERHRRNNLKANEEAIRYNEQLKTKSAMSSKDQKNSPRERKVMSEEEIVNEYEEINYLGLQKVKSLIHGTNENVMEGFIIHVAPQHDSFFSKLFGRLWGKDLEPHWISLVISRLHNGPISYYVSDSFANVNRLQYTPINDIINYVENKDARFGSQFDLSSAFNKPKDQHHISRSDSGSDKNSVLDRVPRGGGETPIKKQHKEFKNALTSSSGWILGGVALSLGALAFYSNSKNQVETDEINLSKTKTTKKEILIKKKQLTSKIDEDSSLSFDYPPSTSLITEDKTA
ncbi:hypothetical protein H0X06_00245 [Candidatus Dependentiae bacterium]|nr:hypothetical protein [Candidatus Dependentiae bacterium]